MAVIESNNNNELLKASQYYNCSCCNEFFSVKEKLELHQIIKHSLLPFKCPKKKCKKSFLQE